MKNQLITGLYMIIKIGLQIDKMAQHQDQFSRRQKNGAAD